MVLITVEPDRLILEVEGTHKLWALKSRLEIPLAHISDAHADPHPAMGWFQGLKLAGTDLPNIFRAGFFLQDGDRVFWDVKNPENTIVIELHDESLARLIVEVDDPVGQVARIKKALASYRAAGK